MINSTFAVEMLWKQVEGTGAADREFRLEISFLPDNREEAEKLKAAIDETGKYETEIKLVDTDSGSHWSLTATTQKRKYDRKALTETLTETTTIGHKFKCSGPFFYFKG